MSATVERWSIADDLEISRVLTGLWQIADMERDGRELDLVAAAGEMEPYVEAGFTTFDMADHYGSSEEIVGHFVARHGARRAELLTKWVPQPGPTSRDDVRTAVQRALDRMQSEQLALLQFHAWNYADPSYLDSLYYLEELRQEGLIGHLGLTNVDTAHLRVILNSGIEIATNQICFSLLDQRAAANGMLQLCADHGVTVLAFGTLAGGFLSERWLDADEPDWDDLETWSQMKYGRFIREVGGWDRLQDVLRATHAAAERHEVSVANVACRYILDQPAVGGVIVGARLGIAEHREDNLRIFGFQLDPESRAAIDAAIGQLRAIPGDCGDEYRKPPYLTAAGDLSDHLDGLPAPFRTVQATDRTQVFSGTVWEDLAGFSRAVRKGNRVLVSGTTATHGTRQIGGSDPEAQADFVIDKIEGSLQSVGARLEDVVRTRIYIQNVDDWEPVSRAHGRRFGHIQPANTLVHAGLVGEGYLVEMEAEAVVSDD
jgi:aryl-alcohol dehydrogenase-like predicted oxidoreductase/enamine deaminase RidA (YjgF/YER057c/UK114 family)